MKIQLNWENFKSPDLQTIKGFDIAYPELKEKQLNKIKTRREFYDTEVSIGYIDALNSQDEENKYIHELYNHIGIIEFYLKHLWFYNSIGPRRFKGDDFTAASIYYEVFYEGVYSKLSSSYDRFLHLVNIYYALGLPKNEVKKDKVKNKICSIYMDQELSKMFNEIDKNENLYNFSKIRNSFIHRESVFEVFFNNNYDSFQYKNKIKSAVEHYIKHIDFLNNHAISFLYKFKDFKPI